MKIFSMIILLQMIINNQVNASEKIIDTILSESIQKANKFKDSI